MQIPISNPPLRRTASRSPSTLFALYKNDLRFFLHLHREGQRAFARKAEPSKNRAQLPPADAKIVRVKA